MFCAVGTFCVPHTFPAINPANLSCFFFVLLFLEKPHIRIQRMRHSGGRKCIFINFFFILSGSVFV